MFFAGYMDDGDFIKYCAAKRYNYIKEKMGGVDKRLGMCDTALDRFGRGMVPRRKRWDVGWSVRRVHAGRRGSSTYKTPRDASR
jgi:hypothetical protein